MQDIMQKIDRSKHRDVEIHPRLITILQELSHHNPELTYETCDKQGMNNPKVVGVAVVMKNEVLGKIVVGERHSRRGESEPTFSIHSKNIGGRRDRKETKHLKMAVKAAKEYFQPTDIKSIVDDVVSAVNNKMRRTVSYARDHARGCVTNAYEPVLAFLADVHNGTVATQIPDKLASSLGTNWQAQLANLRIADAVSMDYAANDGVIVRIERNGTLLVIDLQTKEATYHDTTYGLPTNYQEKITMLKLMDASQPIEHVGVKYDDYDYVNGIKVEYQLFFLVAGDTYTTC